MAIRVFGKVLAWIRELLILDEGIYGLVSGPAWVRASAIESYVELDYVLNPYDRCVLALPAPAGARDQRAKGIVVLEIDLFFEPGDADHRRRQAALDIEYKFGKDIDVYEVTEGAMRAGRRVKQFKGYSFSVDVNEFCRKRLKCVELG
jgi:hypothetical protein